jgi:pimeloyl-ACP methyl ester carboxylesterase
MDTLHLQQATLVGWSDGACTALMLAMRSPERVAGVFYFACNMDPSGVKEFVESPALNRCFHRHVEDYAQFSSTPNDFKEFSAAVGLMQRTQPNCSAEELGTISVPVTIAQSEYDEFIKREHAEYLARSIPEADFVLLPGVSHFAPLQRPQLFNAALTTFLARIGVGPEPAR